MMRRNKTFEGKNVSERVHRIVGLNGSRFITKGDNSSFVDSYQPSLEDVAGKIIVVYAK